jgi:hypothetical protein
MQLPLLTRPNVKRWLFAPRMQVVPWRLLQFALWSPHAKHVEPSCSQQTGVTLPSHTAALPQFHVPVHGAQFPPQSVPVSFPS